MKQASVFLVILFGLLLTAWPLAAQNAGPQAQTAPATPATAPAAPSIANIPTPQSVAQDVQDALAQQQADRQAAQDQKEQQAQIQGLLTTLQNPKTRDAFINNLQGMLKAQAQAQDKEDKKSPPGEKALDAVTKTVSNLGENFTLIGKGFADLPETWRLVSAQFTTAEARERTLTLIGEALTALAAGALAFFIISFFLRRPRDMMAKMPPLSFPARLLVFGGFNFLTLLPIVAFTVAALFTLQWFNMPTAIAHATALFLYAFIVLQLCMWALRMVFATRAPSRRLLPVDDESAAYLYVWFVRLSAMIIFGAFLSQAALSLAIPENTVHAFASLMGFIVTLMVVIIVLQNRRNVAEWLRGTHEKVEEDKDATLKEKRKKMFFFGLREHLAGIWHVLAIIYLIVGYLIATLDIENGFATLTRATVVTVLALLGFYFLLRGIDELVEKGFALPAELRKQFPRLEERTNSYLPILQRVLKIGVWFVAIFVLLSAWGVDTLHWLAQPHTQKFLTAGIAVVVTLFLTVLAWELLGSIIERYLRGEERNGRRIERSARVKTLLPLLRYTMQIVLVIVAGVVILGHIGVNTTPFLAGAGIIGLAIGFGSQALVKDFITGLFILMEDTMSVGDIVKLGDHSGVVEAITIRTVRLRDANGYVHTLAFGDLNEVINMTKHYAQVVLQIPVTFDSDWRRIMKIMKDLTEEMRKEDAFKDAIHEPMEMQGIDRYGDYSATISARIRTRPLQQWNVKREYLLRLKERLDAEGISLPYPISANFPLSMISKKGGQPKTPWFAAVPETPQTPETPETPPTPTTPPPAPKIAVPVTGESEKEREKAEDEAKAEANLNQAKPPPSGA